MDTTRRRFLGGLAVATALTSAAAAEAVTAAPENPELLALGEKFEHAHAKFLQIDDRLPACQAAYRAIAPSGDGVLFTRLPPYLFGLALCTTLPARTIHDGSRLKVKPTRSFGHIVSMGQ